MNARLIAAQAAGRPIAAPSAAMGPRLQSVPSPGGAPQRPGASEPAMLAGLLASVLDQLDYGVWVVDARGGLRHANLAARQECAAARSLRLVDGRLKPVRPGDEARLNAAIVDSRRGRRDLLGVGPEAARVWMAVIPVERADPGDDAGACTLLLGRRHEPGASLSVDFFAKTHRLTLCECGVLRGLVQGLRPAEIARVAGVSVSTVRTHVASVRAKTAAPSIRGLLQQVASLPPIRTLVPGTGAGALADESPSAGPAFAREAGR